jgi:hypothetical protein
MCFALYGEYVNFLETGLSCKQIYGYKSIWCLQNNTMSTNTHKRVHYVQHVLKFWHSSRTEGIELSSGVKVTCYKLNFYYCYHHHHHRRRRRHYHHYHHHYNHHNHFSHWYVDCNTKTNRFSENTIRSKSIPNTPISTLTNTKIVVVHRLHIKVGKIFWNKPPKFLPSIFAVQLKIKTSYHTKPKTFRTTWNYIIFSIRHEILKV